MNREVRMTHDYITDQDLVGRYMAGTLPYDERARFEAHFVDCPHCLDALESVEPFGNALHAFASEVAVAPARIANPGVVWREPDAPPKPKTMRKLMRRAVALAAAAVIAVGIADAVRMRRELARVKATADVSQRELLDADQRELDMKASSAARAKREDAEVPAGALVFPLVKTRGAGGPQNRVVVAGDAAWIVLLADFNASASSRYRATLDTADGRNVWWNDRLGPSSADTLGVAVPSRLLSLGDYILTFEEQPAASDEWQAAARFRFRVVPR
jgi:Putative zinc-finger